MLGGFSAKLGVEKMFFGKKYQNLNFKKNKKITQINNWVEKYCCYWEYDPAQIQRNSTEYKTQCTENKEYLYSVQYSMRRRMGLHKNQNLRTKKSEKVCRG